MRNAQLLRASKWSMEALAAGLLLGGRWRLEAPIGAGGMGEVWRARHEGLGRAAAVKVLRDFIPTGRDRLLQEARILASIRHPAVVEVFDCGDHEGMPFYAMALLDGRTLGERLRSEGPLASASAIAILLPILEGLEAAHAAGVVHRDVKPDNVFLIRQRDGEAPKLVDFGVARVRDRVSRLTVQGHLVGTPDYMAPEQIQGQEPDPRADVWAAAVMLYELVVGRAPFESDNLSRTLYRILHEEVTHEPVIDEALFRVLRRALAKSPEERTPSARAFADDLRGLDQATTPATTAPTKAPTTSATTATLDSADPLRGTLDAMIRRKLTSR